MGARRVDAREYVEQLHIAPCGDVYASSACADDLIASGDHLVGCRIHSRRERNVCAAIHAEQQRPGACSETRQRHDLTEIRRRKISTCREAIGPRLAASREQRSLPERVGAGHVWICRRWAEPIAERPVENEVSSRTQSQDAGLAARRAEAERTECGVCQIPVCTQREVASAIDNFRAGPDVEHRR